MHLRPHAPFLSPPLSSRLFEPLCPRGNPRANLSLPMTTNSPKKYYRRAFHKIVLPSGEEVLMAVGTFDADGKLLSWEPLTHEEPFVEWVGGVFDARKK